MDYLYYWKLFKDDLQNGPIFKLNQNSPILSDVCVGDDVWTIGLVGQGLYSIISRHTVTETGENALGSSDRATYGRWYIKSLPSLSNYFEDHDSVEDTIRCLSIRTEGKVLGQCFQGNAAVRRLTPEDRVAILTHLSG